MTNEEAIKILKSKMDGSVDTSYEWAETVRLAIKALEQPEIIHCRDCKYWMPHTQLGYDEDYEIYHDYCKKLIPDDEYYAFARRADDFCSHAERRTDASD